MKNLLVAEFYKSKNKSIFFLYLLCLVSPFFFILNLTFMFDAWDVKKINLTYFYESIWANSIFLPLPIYIVLTVSLILNIENKAGTWKNLFIQPFSRIKIYVVKYLFILIVLGMSCLIFNITILFDGLFFNFFYKNICFTDFNIIIILNIWLHCFIISLGLISFQFFLNLIIRNVVTSSLIGMFGVFLSTTFLLGNRFYKYIPLSYIRNGLYDYLYDEKKINNTYLILNEHEWYSIISFIVFTIIGFVLLKKTYAK